MNIPRLISFAAVLCLSSAYVILLDQSREPDTHRFSYSFLLLLLLTAVLKLFLTIIMWIISIQCTKEETYHSIPPHTSSGVLATRRIHVDTIEMNVSSHNSQNPSVPPLKFPVPPSPSGTHDQPTDRTMERQSLLIAGGTANHRRTDSVDSTITVTPFRPTPLHLPASPPSQCTILFYDFLRFAISAAIYTVNDIFVFVVMNQGFSARA